jgi:arylsulfatase A-like enzyme
VTVRHVELHARLIPREPTADSYLPAESQTVFRWRFETQADLESWNPENFDCRLEIEDGVLVGEASGPDPWMSRAVDFDASEVDLIEVDASAAEVAQLFWWIEGSGISEQNSLRLAPTGPTLEDEGFFPYRFAVSRHPAWRGKIRGLRFDPTTEPEQVVRIREIRGVRLSYSADEIAALARRPWRAEIDNEVRSVLIAVSGQPIELPISAPPESLLRVSYALEAGARVPTQFQIEAETASGRKHLLLSRRIDPRRESLMGRWREAEVPLSPLPLGDRPVRLLLGAFADGPLRPEAGLPIWGNPEILVRGNGRAKLPNVVLISLDTLRADHLSLYGYGRNTSPEMDRWAARHAIVFEQCVASAPWTLPSHVSLLTGIDAVRHGVHSFWQSSPRDTLHLAEVLRDAGYATLAVTGGGFVSPAYGFARGFDRYRYWARFGEDEEELASGLDCAIEWLRSHRERPFFLFFHTYEIHAPYRPRQPFFAEFTGIANAVPPAAPETAQVRPRYGIRESRRVLSLGDEPGRTGPDVDRGRAIDLYDSGIAYADHMIGKLLRTLSESGLQEESIVVITSDHGEALLERGLAGHTFLYDFNLLVPLLVSLPAGAYAGKRVATQVRLVDVFPTVIEAAGLSGPEGIDGRSLLPLLRGASPESGREAWSYAADSNLGIAVRTTLAEKYVYNDTPWQPFQGREELYRLASDPEETVNHVCAGVDVSALRARARQLWRHAPGVRIRFANALLAPIRGTMRGVRFNNIKGFGLPADCIRMDDDCGARFEVPPGENFEVLVIGEGPVIVSGGVGGDAPRFELDSSREDLGGGGVELLFDGQQWIRGRSSPAVAATGITMWRSGTGAAQPAEPSEAVLDRLRALGYVE